MKAVKTKPASSLEFTITEIHIVPGSNEITIGAISNDPEVKKIHKTSDIQDKVDILTDTKLETINDLFRKLVAVGANVPVSDVTGDIFTKSS